MVQEHLHWHHHVHHTEDKPSEAFLVLHQGFIARFHTWVGTLAESERPDADSISAWHAVPEVLKETALGWSKRRADAEHRLSVDIGSFDSLEELGEFIESSLHGWLHGASAEYWNEPVMATFQSPRSTFFWQLHGLIDHWRQRWVDQNP